MLELRFKYIFVTKERRSQSSLKLFPSFLSFFLILLYTPSVCYVFVKRFIPYFCCYTLVRHEVGCCCLSVLLVCVFNCLSLSHKSRILYVVCAALYAYVIFASPALYDFSPLSVVWAKMKAKVDEQVFTIYFLGAYETIHNIDIEMGDASKNQEKHSIFQGLPELPL